MGGPVGAMSTKLVLKAGVLLFAARLDGHSATATIDPTAAETVITPELAARLKVGDAGEGDKQISRFHVIGLDHAELRLRRVMVRGGAGPATIVIGQDLLAQMRIQLDFGRGRLRVLDKTDRARIDDGGTVIPLKRETGGCLELGAPDGPERIVLVAQADNIPSELTGIPVEVAGFQLPAFDGTSSSSCASATKVVTWTSFRAMRVMIDLPHERLIVGKDHGS